MRQRRDETWQQQIDVLFVQMVDIAGKLQHSGIMQQVVELRGEGPTRIGHAHQILLSIDSKEMSVDLDKVRL